MCLLPTCWKQKDAPFCFPASRCRGSSVGVCSVCRSLSAWRCISVVNIYIETLCLRLCERLLKHCFCPSRPPRGHTDTACCCDVLHCTEEPYHIVTLCYCDKKKPQFWPWKVAVRMWLLESRGSEFFKMKSQNCKFSDGISVFFTQRDFYFVLKTLCCRCCLLLMWNIAH